MTAITRTYRAFAVAAVVAFVFAATSARAEDVKQAADGSIKLTAENAKMVGSGLKLEEGDPKNIGYWNEQADYLEWKVTVEKPGTFSVEINYSLDKGSDGSEIVLAAGDQSVTATLAATEGWGDYKPLKLEALKLDKAGDVTITLKATKKPGDAVMNLRTADLTPAK